VEFIGGGKSLFITEYGFNGRRQDVKLTSAELLQARRTIAQSIMGVEESKHWYILLPWTFTKISRVTKRVRWDCSIKA